MCIRDSFRTLNRVDSRHTEPGHANNAAPSYFRTLNRVESCLLYTSDAADERSSVDLGGRRIIKKKTNEHPWTTNYITEHTNHTSTQPTTWTKPYIKKQ